MDETRLAALEERLRRLEDEQEIALLVASYGPLVDAGAADEVAALWTADGVYDVDERYMGDREAIRDMVRSEDHQGLIRRGCTHFLGPAHVRVDGDSARAVCQSVLLVRHRERTLPVRTAANLWELTRTPDGWRVTRRTTRLLDGSDEARRLLTSTTTDA